MRNTYHVASRIIDRDRLSTAYLHHQAAIVGLLRLNIKEALTSRQNE